MHLLHSQSLHKSEKEPSPFGRQTWACYWGVGAFLGGDGQASHAEDILTVFGAGTGIKPVSAFKAEP